MGNFVYFKWVFDAGCTLQRVAKDYEFKKNFVVDPIFAVDPILVGTIIAGDVNDRGYFEGLIGSRNSYNVNTILDIKEYETLEEVMAEHFDLFI